MFRLAISFGGIPNVFLQGQDKDDCSSMQKVLTTFKCVAPAIANDVIKREGGFGLNCRHLKNIV